jgi:hypothetical protein
MAMRRKWQQRIAGLGALLFLVIFVTACNGTDLPEVIATYPRQEVGQAQAVVTEAQVELSVRDVKSAALKVIDLALTHGGYLIEEQSSGNTRHTLTVWLPAGNFNGFYRGLLALGQLEGERITETVGEHPLRDTHVTIALRQSNVVYAYPAPVNRSWNPANTARAAATVFLSLFRAVVDALIWILVVAGPFALMFLGLLALIRRLHRQSQQAE